MAPDPEALAQLSRLLGDDALRVAVPDEIASAVDSRFDRLVEGLVAETAASDDVTDTATALDFIDARLRFFESLIDEPRRSRLRAAVCEKIEAW